jgi:hypothetical protein
MTTMFETITTVLELKYERDQECERNVEYTP